jgi:hypothetical protein
MATTLTPYQRDILVRTLDYRVEGVINPFALKVASLGLLEVLKRAKDAHLTTDLNASNPSVAVAAPINARLPAGVVGSSVDVLLLPAPASDSQVSPRVIEPVSVNMVYFAGWPFPGHVQPRQSVRVKSFTAKRNHYAVLFRNTSDHRTGVRRLAVGEPESAEKTTFWIVMQKAFKGALIYAKLGHRWISAWRQHPLSMGAA